MKKEDFINKGKKTIPIFQRYIFTQDKGDYWVTDLNVNDQTDFQKMIQSNSLKSQIEKLKQQDDQHQLQNQVKSQSRNIKKNRQGVIIEKINLDINLFTLKQIKSKMQNLNRFLFNNELINVQTRDYQTNKISNMMTTIQVKAQDVTQQQIKQVSVTHCKQKNQEKVGENQEFYDQIGKITKKIKMNDILPVNIPIDKNEGTIDQNDIKIDSVQISKKGKRFCSCCETEVSRHFCNHSKCAKPCEQQSKDLQRRIKEEQKRQQQKKDKKSKKGQAQLLQNTTVEDQNMINEGKEEIDKIIPE